MPAAPLPPNPDPVLNQTITPALRQKHGLLPEEYGRIQEFLGREPTLTELGIFSVMWSEHCSYKNTRPLLKGFPTEKKGGTEKFGRVLVKAGEEKRRHHRRRGGLGHRLQDRVAQSSERGRALRGCRDGRGRNHPRHLHHGARPEFLTNSLRFGDLSSPATKRLLRGVVAGIAHYGNCVGVPTVGGDVYFDRSYEGNPWSMRSAWAPCGTIRSGAAGPREWAIPSTTSGRPRGGTDWAEPLSPPGIERGQRRRPPGGAEGGPLHGETPDRGLPRDDGGARPGGRHPGHGAAGLTCSTCETASRGGAGIEIELDRVPQREPGMNSYEIMLSESQERMLVIVERGREKEIEEIFAKWDLHAARIGAVTDTGRMGGAPARDRGGGHPGGFLDR